MIWLIGLGVVALLYAMLATEQLPTSKSKAAEIGKLALGILAVLLVLGAIAQTCDPNAESDFHDL